MYDRIVVPLDGSRLAEVALPYAEELASKVGCELILLTVLESGEACEYEKYYMYVQKVAKLTKRHAEKYLENGGCKATEVGTATRTGNPAEAIIEYTSQGGFPLIIMASHGRSGVSRWAVGSVADKVVRGTKWQPVMLIRAKESRSDIREKRILKKALVPLDGSVRSRAIIPYIKEIASKLQMELTLLQVVPPTNHTHTDAEAYLQMECHTLEDEGITARYEVGVGAAADKIIDLANELAFDLVAMSTHGKTGAIPWSLGGVAQKVFLGGNTPLLLVRE
ncbi:MAG: universal stress protein [Chloroflexota bacterium]